MPWRLLTQSIEVAGTDFQRAATALGDVGFEVTPDESIPPQTIGGSVLRALSRYEGPQDPDREQALVDHLALVLGAEGIPCDVRATSVAAAMPSYRVAYRGELIDLTLTVPDLAQADEALDAIAVQSELDRSELEVWPEDPFD